MSAYPPPPGMNARAFGPPAEAPPPAPPGIGVPQTSPSWQGSGLGALGSPLQGPAGGTDESSQLEMKKEIANTIEVQVARLIEQARHDTETKVKMELKTIRDAMMATDARLDQMLAQLDSIEPTEPPEPPLEPAIVGQLLSKIEQRWGQEIRTLKQELHQTILAHNHNADLIKHQKDAIDALRERCMKLQSNSAKNSQIQQQLQQLDARLKTHQKQRRLETFFERLAALEQRVALAQGSAWRYPGMPPMVTPGMNVPQGIPPALMLGMGAAGGMPGKGTAVKGGLGYPGVDSTTDAASASGKAGDKAAFKCPADDEVQAHLSKFMASAEAGGAAALAGLSGSAEATLKPDASTEAEGL